MTVDEVSFNPRSGLPNGTAATSTPEQVAATVQAAVAAAPIVAAVPPSVRAAWLDAIAAALLAARDELAELAEAETALRRDRLDGEVDRVANQLRFYGQVAQEGSFLGAVIENANPLRQQIVRVSAPLGPVAVFGASNFPFAFGLLGNDTAAAIAAGCPVVAKHHPAHPLLSRRLAELAVAALAEADAPRGTFDAVSGFEAGTALVDHRDIRAVAFTGSQSGGMHLYQRAQQRDEVIPVYAEMGTINPVVITPSASQVSEIAAGFVSSFTLGSGQYCTKPGILFAPRGRSAPEAVADALHADNPQQHMLTQAIAEKLESGIAEAVQLGATLVAQIPGPTHGWGGAAAVLSVDPSLIVAGSPLLEERFGSFALVVEYGDLSDLSQHVEALHGALTASVMTSGPDDPDVVRLLDLLTPKVGRVSVDNWPTGVAVNWAQHHGGPWPATSEPRHTSVGASALERFVRPVAYQNVPEAALPTALRPENPWGITRRVDGLVVPGARP